MNRTAFVMQSVNEHNNRLVLEYIDPRKIIKGPFSPSLTWTHQRGSKYVSRHVYTINQKVNGLCTRWMTRTTTKKDRLNLSVSEVMAWLFFLE